IEGTSWNIPQWAKGGEGITIPRAASAGFVGSARPRGTISNPLQTCVAPLPYVLEPRAKPRSSSARRVTRGPPEAPSDKDFPPGRRGRSFLELELRPEAASRNQALPRASARNGPRHRPSVARPRRSRPASDAHRDPAARFGSPFRTDAAPRAIDSI